MLMIVLAIAAGCAFYPGPSEGLQRLERIAPADWTLRPATAAVPPLLLGYAPSGGDPGRPLVIYIEGDGRAWLRRNQVSQDPTPGHPVGFRLAVATPEGAGYGVAYLARPCQFVGRGNPDCETRLWTSHRYGRENLDAMSAAVDQLKQGAGQRIVLVGYSGGGVIAALLAAVRNDVSGMVTVAANLDTRDWTTLHGVTPLDGSLSPVDFGQALKRVPQVHFTGGNDTIVPTSVVRSYLEGIGLPEPGHLVEVEGYDHQCCWEESWPDNFRAALAALGVLSIEE